MTTLPSVDKGTASQGGASDAVALIRNEHRTLRTVIEMLRELLGKVARGHAEPDFGLFSAALYYIDEFPERVHHPKEDEYLFKALRARTSEFNAILDELQAEHIQSTRTMRQLFRALVRYQAGATGGLQEFRTTIEAYAVMQGEHMRKEEELLRRAIASLTAEEWTAVTAAFEANEDPLLGDDRRGEFRTLYRRIVNKLPQKLKLRLSPGIRDM